MKPLTEIEKFTENRNYILTVNYWKSSSVPKNNIVSMTSQTEQLQKTVGLSSNKKYRI